ncbi:MAG: DUF2786 domain-containing protein [Actinobacteria bacterium]|nr:DUF2786 domain-containing protein [Actinomycetota bacterium]
MNKENVIDKVRKLLAIANKSNYPEEAMSTMLKAQEIMAKHGIESMELSLVLVKDAVVVKAVEEKKLKKGRTHNYSTNHDEHARAAGYRQGKDFDHNTKLINSCCS